MDPFIPLTEPGPAEGKRREKREELHPAASYARLAAATAAAGVRGGAQPRMGVSMSAAHKRP